MPPHSGSDRQRRHLLARRVDHFTSHLAAATGSDPVPGLAWSVADLGAHLVVLPRLYQEANAGPEPLPLPPDLHASSAERVAAVETRDVTELAHLIHSEMDALLAQYGDDPDQRFNHWVTRQPLSVLESTLLNEFLIHGWDLARAQGRRYTIGRAEAITAFEGILPVAANFVDPEAAAGLSAVVHLHLRGGDSVPGVDWTQAIDAGVMTVTKGKPARADVHINADPETFLLLSVGRIGPIKPALTGKVVVYGRKPWLAARLPNIFLDV